VTVCALDLPTVFQNFEDYWRPLLGRTGAAPTYLASVSGNVRAHIRRHLKARLTVTHDGPIALSARAWAGQGVV
jgi:hypothetical protein